MNEDGATNGGLTPEEGASNVSPDPPPAPRAESPLGFAAAPTEPPPTSPPVVGTWNTTTFGASSPQSPDIPLTMSEPAPIPAPITSGSSGSSKLPWIAAVVAAVVLLGGGAFFAASVFGASGGADSPQAAADGLLAALENEDFVTAAELLEPSERRTIAEPILTKVLPELIRLGVADESTEASNVEDFDLELASAEYRVEELVGVDDIAHVYFTGGEVGIDGAIESLPTDSETPLVIVERDGQWYYSLWFTLAENARLEAGEQMPSEADAPAPIPSDSPEGAVEGMMDAVSNLDLRSMIGHMDPEEMAALYRYSPLFLDEAQDALDEAQGDLTSDGFQWELSDFDFDVDENGDDAVVSMRGFSLVVSGPDFEMNANYQSDTMDASFIFDGGSVTVDATTTEFSIAGSADGETGQANILIEPDELRVSGSGELGEESAMGELTLDRQGECSQYSVTATNGTDESGCLEDEEDADVFVNQLIEQMEEWPSEFPGVDIRVRQTNNGWFVSPMGTVFDGVVTTLQGIEEDDFDGLFDGIAGGVNEDIFEEVVDGLVDVADGDSDFDATEAFDDGPVTGFTPATVEDTSVLDYDPSVPLSVQGAISLNTYDAFEFTVDSGTSTLVTVIADGSSLDAYVLVRDPNGVEIASNDDAFASLPSSFDSQTGFVADVAGTYTIEVSAFADGSEGGYELTVEPGEVDLTSTPETIPNAVLESLGTIEVATGETVVVDGLVGGAQGDALYDIELVGGDDVVIIVETADPDGLDPRVTLSLDGVLVDSNDDAADSDLVADFQDSRLPVALDADGTYQIVIDGFAGSEGAFTMTIARN